MIEALNNSVNEGGLYTSNNKELLKDSQEKIHSDANPAMAKISNLMGKMQEAMQESPITDTEVKKRDNEFEKLLAHLKKEYSEMYESSKMQKHSSDK